VPSNVFLVKTFSFSIDFIKIESYVVSMSKKLIDEKKVKLRGTKNLLARLTKVIDDVNQELPRKIDALILQKLDKLTAKDFINFVGRELLEIYVEAGGRKALVQYYKKNPKELARLLTTIADVFSNIDKREQTPTGNTGVTIQFIGLQQKEEDKQVIEV